MAALIVRAEPARFNTLFIGHDDQTEVLTEAGWIRWADYDGKSPIGTVRPSDGILQFQKPTGFAAHEYDGPMVACRHRSIDLLVSPAHPLYLRRWDERARTLEGGYRFVEAGRIGWYAGLMHAPSGFMGAKVAHMTIGRFAMSGDDFLALLALVVSDGYVASTDSNRDRIGFCCFRPKERPMVAALASRLGFTEQASRPGVWYTKDAGLAAWLRDSIYDGQGIGAIHKRIPRIVMTAPPQQIEHFLTFFGDRNHNGPRSAFYSSSKAMIDDLQVLLLRLGRRSSIFEGKAKDTIMSDGRTIRKDRCATPYTLVERQKDKLSVSRMQHVTERRYRGVIFSAATRNPLIVTRRNGRVLISGSGAA